MPVFDISESCLLSLATVGAMLGMHFPSFSLAAISSAFSNSKFSKMSKDIERTVICAEKNRLHAHFTSSPSPSREGNRQSST